MIGCKYPLEAPLQGHFKQTTCSSTSYPYKTIHLICVCTTLEYISAKIHQEIPIEFKFWFFTSTHHTRFLGVLHWFINHERGFTFVFFLITCVANIWCKFCEYLSQKIVVFDIALYTITVSVEMYPITRACKPPRDLVCDACWVQLVWR